MSDGRFLPSLSFFESAIHVFRPPSSIAASDSRDPMVVERKVNARAAGMPPRIVGQHYA